MRKLFILCMLVTLSICIFCGCSANSGKGNPAEASMAPSESIKETTIADQTENTSSGETSKKLVVYFSMPETTDPDNMSREEELSTVVINGEVLGNTQYVAYIIQQNTGADIFRIEPVTPYPSDHSELEDIAQREQQENARPEIAGVVENIDQYDTVFFGFPNWYYDMPMIMYSFLDQYDLSGKTIVPFVTSGGSGFSDAISTIVEMESDATVITDGLSISRNVVQDAEQDIIDWLNENSLVH